MSRRIRSTLAGGLVLAALLFNACAGAPPKPPTGAAADAQWQRAMKSGRSAFERGQLRLAEDFYQAALMRGRTMDTPEAIANAAYNLAACKLGQGRYDSARTLLGEAKAELLRIGENAGDVLLLEARIAWLLGEPQAALTLTEELLAPSASGHPEHLLQAHLLRGRIACDRKDPQGAIAELQKAEPLMGDDPNPAVTAGLCSLAGCIYLQQGKAGQAARQFDREAELLREAGQYGRMEGALQRAAEAYEEAGRKAQAADRWFRAARATLPRKDFGQARALGDRALAAAEGAHDQGLQERIRLLLEEIAGEELER